MLELRGKIAECYIECFCRMFYVVFKSELKEDEIEEIEKKMLESYNEWASGDNENILDICCEEYILSTLENYKDKMLAVIYEDIDEEDIEL